MKSVFINTFDTKFNGTGMKNSSEKYSSDIESDYNKNDNNDSNINDKVKSLNAHRISTDNNINNSRSILIKKDIKSKFFEESLNKV